MEPDLRWLNFGQKPSTKCLSHLRPGDARAKASRRL
uniref:Uncharacterized protein n=1 Tax=Physcomitrium patens TaxID=3218 RepID=A0A2K1L172_PHYPA|nr:hypothetical protein PHYPA_002570 [Physcomitrium patens]